MIIQSVESFALKVPMIKPILMAGVSIAHAQTLIIRMESKTGVVGWGEITSAPSHGGQTLEEMHRIFKEDVQLQLIGKDAQDLAGAYQSIKASSPRTHTVLAGVDIALYDLVGKTLGVPAYTLLGGKKRSTLAPLWLIGTKSVDTDVEEAKKRFAEGYRFFKLKLGIKSIEEEIASALSIRKELGASAKICGDSNMGYTTENTIRFIEGTAAANISYLEQPLPKDQLGGLMKVCELGITKIGLDESITSLDDIIESKTYGVSGVSLKTLKLEGMSGVLQAAHICDGLGMEINLAGKIAETSIASAAVLQIAAALNHVNWGVSPSHLFLAEDVVDAPISPTHGEYMIPQTPGLGITVNEASIQRFQVSL
jgi:muconate cycloisomerase